MSDSPTSARSRASSDGGLVQIGRSAGDEGFISEEDAARWSRVRPQFAHIYVENRCNLKCAHCYESEETHPTHLRLSLDDYREVLEGLAKLGVLVITFSGGEPFLRRDFLDIVALARRMRFATRIYTSGTLIDEKKADRLKQLMVTEVHVSVYSHDPEVHDRFTGIPGSHRRSLEAIRLLKARGLSVTLKANILTINVDHLDELVDLAESLHAGIIFGPEVWTRISGDEAPLRYLVGAEELSRKVFSRPELQDRIHHGDFPGECDGDGKWSAGNGLCAAAKRIVTVGADGNVYACTMFPVPGGNYRQRSIEDIWFRSKVFDGLRRATFGDMNECPTCEERQYCSPCMAFGQVEHGDHRACNSTSRNSAVALRLVADRRRSAETKMSAGRSLPIVGDADAPRPHRHAVVLSVEEFV